MASSASPRPWATCRPCAWIYIPQALQFGEWHPRRQHAHAMQILRQVTAGENLPRQRNMARIDARVHPDAGRAVVDQGVVELGLRLEVVDALHVLQEHSPPILERAVQAINVHILRRVLAVAGTQADHVTLVGHDVMELVLL